MRPDMAQIGEGASLAGVKEQDGFHSARINVKSLRRRHRAFPATVFPRSKNGYFYFRKMKQNRYILYLLKLSVPVRKVGIHPFLVCCLYQGKLLSVKIFLYERDRVRNDPRIKFTHINVRHLTRLIYRHAIMQ